MTQRLHLHLVSDSTGETVSSVARSVLSQFDGVEAEEHMWSLVRTKGQMERVIESIRQEPGMVMYTIIDDKLQQKLQQACQAMQIPCVHVLSEVLESLTKFLGVEAKGMVGRQHALDEDYFKRVEAINFTLAHDDGQNTDNLEEADVVLVGVSRTSKTPTCVYLSYRGVNAANVPYVKDIPLPDNLFELKKPLVIGLVISPERLVQIRKSRLVSLNEDRDTSYVDLAAIKDEILEARKLFTKHGWPVIDVTRRSVEETTANIMQLYHDYIEAQNDD